MCQTLGLPQVYRNGCQKKRTACIAPYVTGIWPSLYGSTRNSFSPFKLYTVSSLRTNHLYVVNLSAGQASSSSCNFQLMMHGRLSQTNQNRSNFLFFCCSTVGAEHIFSMSKCQSQSNLFWGNPATIIITIGKACWS